jgi:prephenate dehydratase
MKQRISYQGIAGAYSFSACQKAAPDYEPLACTDFLSAIKAVQNGEAECAMLPVNNKIAGRVADIHRLIPDSGLFIVGEYYLPIQHCLLGVPGTNIDDIKIVSSHVHALPQCEKYIAEHPSWSKLVSGDTATAAFDVSQKQDKTRAAIASPDAAKIYELKILADNIADVTGNVTRFIIMAPETSYAPKYLHDVKTSLLFKIKEGGPGQLYNALGGFAKNSINMTTLESYQDDRLEISSFYCEVERHIDDPHMKAAMEELSKYAEPKIIGVYPAHKIGV